MNRYIHRVMIVGQAPAEGHDGDPAFRGTRSGANLAQYMGLASFADVELLFDLENVLKAWPGRQPSGKGDLFPLKEARAAAAEMVGRLAPRRLLLLGGATAAFGVDAPHFTWVRLAAASSRYSKLESIEVERRSVAAGTEGHRLVDLPSTMIATCPHPSGGSRFWNTGECKSRGCDFLRLTVRAAAIEAAERQIVGVDGLGGVDQRDRAACERVIPQLLRGAE